MLRAALAGEHAAETTVLNGRTWLVAAHPLHDEDGTAAGAVAVLTFADEAEVHRELTEKEALNEQFGALIELSKDFIAIADLDGTVTFVNRAGRALVGLASDEEALGRPTADYFTEQGKAKSQEIEDAVREHGYWEGETQLRHFGTGEAIPVSANSFLVTRSSDGTPLALATVQRDLRHRIRQERALAVRAQEQRAVAELGRLALTMPLNQLMRETVSWSTPATPGWSRACCAAPTTAGPRRWWRPRCPNWVPVVLDLDEDSLTGRALMRNELVYTDDVVTTRRSRTTRRPPGSGCAPRCAARSRRQAPLGHRRHLRPGTPGTGPRTTSRSSSPWPRRWGPPYAGTSWRASCSTRPCTTR